MKGMEKRNKDGEGERENRQRKDIGSRKKEEEWGREK